MNESTRGGNQGPLTDSEPPPLYHYTIVRADLPEGMRRAQICHASDESTSEWTLANQKRIPTGTHAVSLLAPGEGKLLELYHKLLEHGIQCVLINEPDEPYCGQAMAVGCWPMERSKTLRRLTSGFPLSEEKRTPC